MFPLCPKQSISIAPALAIALSVLLVISFTSCNKSAKESQGEVAVRTFASPEEAGTALADACKANDQAALLAIFGPDAKPVLFSGDSVKDKDALQDFAAAYAQMHRWSPIKAGGEMLYTGADNFIFPVPLDHDQSGRWHFDTAAGKDEILARRIGKGELTAIAACAASADAQKQYFNQLHDGSTVKQYAQKFVSDEGKHNGLYWPSAEGQAPSPLGPVGDFAKALGYQNAGEKPQPFNGYFFRILTKQGSGSDGAAKDYIVDGNMTGGFAILAYPAEYRNTGIMTFVVGKDGIIYQKDLGQETASLGAATTEYNPDSSWQKVVGTEPVQ